MNMLVFDSVDSFYANRPFRRSNMEVRREDGWTGILQHGNLIGGRHDGGFPILRDCGWQTATTKERLNALLAPYGWTLYQESGEWILRSHSHGEEKPWHGSVDVAELVELDETIALERKARHRLRIARHYGFA